MISREGALVAVRADTVLRAGDEILLLTDPEAEGDAESVFRCNTRP